MPDGGADEELEYSPWEQKIIDALEREDLPPWEFSAQAAHYKAGHRGIVDAGLAFPTEYLQEPMTTCYVWRAALKDETRVHVYADEKGEIFHIPWRVPGKSKAQTLPEHISGRCALADCQECAAAQLVAEICLESRGK